jgi:uncharacterized protein YbjQ (UPF0145 family)
MIVTTTPSVEGHRIVEYLGVVAAQTVLGVDFVKDFAAGFSNIFGGRSASYEGEYASGVATALAELERECAARGANGIVGVDIDYETVSTGQMLLVSATGTAVRLEPLS